MIFWMVPKTDVKTFGLGSATGLGTVGSDGSWSSLGEAGTNPL